MKMLQKVLETYRHDGWLGVSHKGVRYLLRLIVTWLMAQPRTASLIRKLPGSSAIFGPPHWLVESLRRQIVQGKVKLHGDYIRVDVFGFEHQDAVRPLLDNLQAKLLKNGLDPRIPWLNNHRICFRFM